MSALILVIFVVGYIAIAFEHSIHINKAATALITGVLCWTVYIVSANDYHLVAEQLEKHLGELSGILFFLLGAMTIVELIDAHEGFNIITDRINQTSKRKLLWIVSLIAFFLSPLLDNLTTAIVMVSLIRKLINTQEDRLLFTGMVVIAANAGGAWSPIGDVTTTMLWIGGQVTAGSIILNLFVPSIICLIVPLTFFSLRISGKISRPVKHSTSSPITKRQQYIIFFSSVLILVLVPVYKSLTHLPPYMGILIGLGMLWVITEIMHGNKEEVDKGKFSVSYALRKIDSSSILFFLGILLSISALQSVGILKGVASWASTHVANDNVVAMSIGLLSSIVDNVPLVAASQGMFSLNEYPTDHYFWNFLAYTTGTGGSALIIGSAAGVAAMGMEKISFMWYLKKVTVAALMGFFAGAAIFILQSNLL